jgi:hypothetical protein
VLLIFEDLTYCAFITLMYIMCHYALFIDEERSQMGKPGFECKSSTPRFFPWNLGHFTPDFFFFLLKIGRKGIYEAEHALFVKMVNNK